jgi:hypothetical protein
MIESTGFAARQFFARFPEATVSEAGGIAPFQVLGTLRQWPFYLRSRGGATCLSLYAPGSGIEVPGSEPLWEARADWPLEALTTPKTFDRFEELLEKLERPRFLYSFMAEEVLLTFTTAGARVQVIRNRAPQLAWGHSEDEARLQAILPPALTPYLAAEQLALISSRWVADTPMEQDHRPESSPAPVFITRGRS